MVTPTHVSLLRVPCPPLVAHDAHVFEYLHTFLILVGQLYDSGCKFEFQATQVQVWLNNKIITHGPHDTTVGKGSGNEPISPSYQDLI
jgi:hypothetical protein